MTTCKKDTPTDIMCFMCSADYCLDRINANCATCRYVDNKCPELKQGRYCGRWERAPDGEGGGANC